MIQDIIGALSKAINKTLNTNTNKKYTVYIENVKQDLKEPCFFIYCKDYKDELYRGKRYKVEADIAIEYMPREDEEELNKDVNDILQQLYDITESIEVDGNLLRGLNRQVENAEGCVVLSVRYEYFYYKTDDIEPMEILKERTDVNG